MSQVYFKANHNGKRVEVMSGYDPPLNYFFLTVFKVDLNDEEEDLLWSELDHFGFDELRTTEPLKKVLNDLEIVPPDNFWETVELQEDGRTVRIYNPSTYEFERK